MELPSECALSTIEIKEFIFNLLIDYTFSIDTGNCLMSKEREHIIFKHQQGDWCDMNFSMIMKKFSSIFRNNIAMLSENFHLTFNREIPQEY